MICTLYIGAAGIFVTEDKATDNITALEKKHMEEKAPM